MLGTNTNAGDGGAAETAPASSPAEVGQAAVMAEYDREAEFGPVVLQFQSRNARKQELLDEGKATARP